jgi:hypothetical protein
MTTASVGERWKGWAAIVTAAVAILAFVLGGGFLYQEVWKSKVLSFTALPLYEVRDQVFAGLVVENRGRVNLSEVKIIAD